jgi:hypothetical protein
MSASINDNRAAGLHAPAGSPRTAPADSRAARLRTAEDALHRVQAQAAALEELSEQLSLGVHMLEAELGALAEQARAEELAASARAHAEPAAPAHVRSTDADGARLIALNMALGGSSRADTDRFLAENYELEDRQKLLDEVYAAIEG